MKVYEVAPLGTPPPHWRAMLPCPFCDGAAQMVSGPKLSNPALGCFAAVCCSRCGAGGPTVEPRDARPLEAIERHAVRLWNRRGSHQNADWKLRRIAQILGSDYGA